MHWLIRFHRKLPILDWLPPHIFLRQQIKAVKNSWISQKSKVYTLKLPLGGNIFRNSIHGGWERGRSFAAKKTTRQTFIRVWAEHGKQQNDLSPSNLEWLINIFYESPDCRHSYREKERPRGGEEKNFNLVWWPVRNKHLSHDQRVTSPAPCFDSDYYKNQGENNIQSRKLNNSYFAPWKWNRVNEYVRSKQSFHYQLQSGLQLCEWLDKTARREKDAINLKGTSFKDKWSRGKHWPFITKAAKYPVVA